MLLSIVTINYNNASGLLKTINSVLNQTWKNFEYIIIDGGSTDKSTSIIKEHEKSTDYWVSEKDKGVFHAMNKGIEQAKGEYLLMLNSSDCLYNDKVLEKVFGDSCPKEDILYGDCYFISKNEIVRNRSFTNYIDCNFFITQTLSHQATFIRKELHQLSGYYDEQMRFASDRKFFTDAFCKVKCSYRHLSYPVALCDADGLTFDPSNFAAMYKEVNKILKEYFPKHIITYRKQSLIQILKHAVKRAYKKILSNKI